MRPMAVGVGKEHRHQLSVERPPRGLIEARPTELADLLGRPTLYYLQGGRPEPLFLSIMLSHSPKSRHATRLRIRIPEVGSRLPKGPCGCERPRPRTTTA